MAIKKLLQESHQREKENASEIRLIFDELAKSFIVAVFSGIKFIPVR